MTFKRIAAAIAGTLLALLACVAPASADTTVPIRSDAALCQVPCERVGQETALTSKQLATPCQYNYSVCGYESFNHLCDDGCEVIPRTTPGCEPVALSNQWSSFYNNSGRTVRLYDTGNCTSSYITFYNGTGTAYFLVTNPDWENKVSSVRFL